MKQTRTYKLRCLENGDFYGSRTDNRRFSTIDTHMGEFVKAIGNGVIEGWDIKVVTGNEVSINPGWGIINGLFSETPWIKNVLTGEPIREKEAKDNGYLIISKIPGWSNPGSGPDSWFGSFYKVGGNSLDDALEFLKLGPEGEDLDNDNIVEGVLNPYYKEPSDQFYDDPYVKAVEKSSISFYLDNNTETYLFARRLYDDPLKTFVEFTQDTSDTSGPSKILLAKVIVRDGEVVKIDYSATRQLKGMAGTIAAMAKNYIKKHRHGGGRSFDPPSLNLETDIRNARLSIVGSDNAIKYQVYGNFETSATESHKHTYTVNELGTGCTQEVIGSSDFHYHFIEDFVVQTSMKNYDSTLVDHTHEIETKTDTWNRFSPARVWVNDEIMDPEKYILDSENKTIIFLPGVLNSKLAVYSTSFPIDDKRVFSFEKEERSVRNFVLEMMKEFINTYRSEMANYVEDTDEYKAPTVRNPFDFVVIDDKDVEQGKESYVYSDPTPINIWPDGPAAEEITKVMLSPFKTAQQSTTAAEESVLKYADKDSEAYKNTLKAIADRQAKFSTTGLRPMSPYFEQQMAMAASKLVKAGDKFVLLPYVARFIPITLVSPPLINKVTLEILEKVEVQGKLKSESLLFIKAEKFTTGEFDKSILPLIGHAGRIREPVIPEYSKTYTDDGYRFFSVPTRASSSFGHGHLVTTNRMGDGVTTATTVNGEITVSQYAGDELLRIAHTHSISSGTVADVANSSINQWQEVQDTTSHSHELDIQISGDSKSVFSVLEDINGNLYFGTSDGLMEKPKEGGYEIVINGYSYQSALSSAYEASKEAFKRHSELTGEYVEFSDDKYAMANYTSFTSKTSMNCSTYAYGPSFSGSRKDTNGQKLPIATPVFISPKEIINVGNFYKLSVKTKEELSIDDEILFVYKAAKDIFSSVTSPSALFQLINETPTTDGETVDLYLVKQSYNKSTVWSLTSNDNSIISCSNEQICKLTQKKSEWSQIQTPSGVAILKGLIKDSKGNILIPTNSGLIQFSKNFSYEKARLLSDIDGETDIYDAIEASPLNLLASTEEGVYLSTDEGETWIPSLPGEEIIQFSRDHWMDAAKLNSGHIHYLLVNQDGNGITTNAFDENDDEYFGPQHVHIVKSWVISEELGHTHDVKTSIFGLSKSNKIFKTIDNGLNWEKVADAPSEFGEIGKFSAANGKLLCACEKGLSSFSNLLWSIILPMKVRSFSWSYLFDRIFIGCDNSVYEMTESTLKNIASFVGGPVPSVILDDAKKHFGFSFNNLSSKIAFENQMKASAQVLVSLSYDIWNAKEGGWSDGKDYEIFAGDKTVINTKTGLDRRSELGLNFVVNPSNGTLDFTKVTSLSATINAGESKLSVKNPNYFEVGGTLAVVKFPEKPTDEELATLSESEKAKLEEESTGMAKIEKRIIVSKANTVITVDRPFQSRIDMPAKVKFLSITDENLEIFASIYQTQFDNIGRYSHQDVEDSLSMESAGSPYELSNTHISNLSELTLALKYALPDVDSRYKNWESYMMRFERNPGDIDSIENSFNTNESNLRSGVSVETPINPVKSTSVNVIAPGGKTYSDLMFVGTDVGLFIAKKEPDIPPNWFAVYDCPAGAIYDIGFPGGDKVLVAGSNGTWATKGGTIKTWELVEGTISRNSSYFIKNRWTNFGQTGNSWWNNWGDEGNLTDPDITNTIIVGGQDFVMLSSDNGKSWLFGVTPMDAAFENGGTLSYRATSLLPLKSGEAILVANSVGKGLVENDLLITQGLGDTWDYLYRFSTRTGKVVSINNSNGGNTKIEVEWTDGLGIRVNSLIGNYAIFGNKKYKILRNRNETVILFGLEPSSYISIGDLFKIEAPTINAIAEDSNETLYVVSGENLLTDVKTRKAQNKRLGRIIETNKSAIVSGIDSSGTIDSVKTLPSFMGEDKKTSLVCTLDRQAVSNSFVGKEITVTGYIAPSVSFISPYAEEVVKSSTLVVSLSIQSFDIGTSGNVSIKLDSREAIITSSSVYIFEGVSKGSHTLKAQLLGADGKALTNEESSTIISFSTEFSETTPSVQIVSPAEGEALNSGTFKAVFSVSNFTTGIDGTLYYSIDDTGYLPITPFGSGIAELTIQGISDGTHNIKAKLINNSTETVGEESLVSFSVVSGGLPGIVITSPIESMTISLTSLDIKYVVSNVLIPGDASVKFTLDSSQEFITTNSSSFTLTGLSNGSHTLKAEIIDVNLKPFTNSSAKATVSFKVDLDILQSPTLTITYPFDGLELLKSDYIDLLFITENFDMPKDGGIVIKVNNGAEAFLETLEPYKIPGVVGDYTVTATLASSPTVKLTGQFASMTVGFKVVEQATPRSVITSTSTKSYAKLQPETVLSPSPIVSSLNSITKTTTRDTSGESVQTDRRWKIISNSSSALTGSTTIIVNGIMPQNIVNQAFRIVGESSIIYLSYDQNVSIGEFDGGLVYIDESEDNAFKSYTITRQFSDRVEIKELIDPLKELEDTDVKNVYKGQKIRLLPKNGASTVWVDFSRKWGEDELCGAVSRVQGYSETEEETASVQGSFIISDNDENSITLYKANPYTLRIGDYLDLRSVVMIPLMTFLGKNAVKNLDHWHNTELIGKFISGSISSISPYGSSYVDITVVSVESLSNPLIVSNPTLLAGETILCYDPSDPRRSYRKKIVSISGNIIRVKRGDINDWSSNVSSLGISSGWNWTVDARWYGQTSGIFYDNFITFQSRLLEDAAAGQNLIKLEDISGVSIGDDIELWDSISNLQAFKVSDIVSSDSIETDSPLLKTYKVSNGCHLRVRKSYVPASPVDNSSTSSGSGEHSHLIKDGEVYEAKIEEYTQNGYPYSHSHELSGLIQEIKALSFEYDSGRIVAAGNSSKIYASNDNGQTWEVILDAETILGDWNGSFICMNKTKDGDLLIGTNDGRFIGQGVPEQDTLITYPGNDQFMPSSSSVSTSSSISSISSKSSSSSNLSKSSSSSTSSQSSTSTSLFTTS